MITPETLTLARNACSGVLHYAYIADGTPALYNNCCFMVYNAGYYEVYHDYEKSLTTECYDYAANMLDRYTQEDVCDELVPILCDEIEYLWAEVARLKDVADNWKDFSRSLGSM